MTVDFNIDYSEMERLSANIARLGNKSESTLNKSLEKHGEKVLVPRITSLIKTSRNPDGRGIRDKVHANQSKWSKSEMGNLQVTIKSKGGAANKRGSFGYLVFPDEGRGPYNPIEQNFMSRGAKDGTSELVSRLQDDLIRAIEEEL